MRDIRQSGLTRGTRLTPGPYSTVRRLVGWRCALVRQFTRSVHHPERPYDEFADASRSAYRGVRRDRRCVTRRGVRSGPPRGWRQSHRCDGAAATPGGCRSTWVLAVWILRKRLWLWDRIRRADVRQRAGGAPSGRTPLRELRL